MMERGGKLKNIECQVHVEFRTFDHGKIKMIPDFRAVDCATGEVIYIEAKGLRTPSYVRKEKAWFVGGPATLYVYGGHWQCPKLLKIVTPKEEKKY
jgi:hypothetical protein